MVITIIPVFSNYKAEGLILSLQYRAVQYRTCWGIACSVWCQVHLPCRYERV